MSALNEEGKNLEEHMPNNVFLTPPLKKKKKKKKQTMVDSRSY